MSGSLAERDTPRFQEAAAAARLYAWGARALYVGPALNLSAHRNAVAVLALGLEGPFEVAETPGEPGSAYRSCRSALIPPNTLHQLRAGTGRMAFLYVDARSRDLERLRAAARERGPRADFHLAFEGPVLSRLRDLDHGRRDWGEVRNDLSARLAERADGEPDPRIARALSTLHADPAARRSLDQLAAIAGLSASRFRRLFRATTGVTLRRYRLWVAMGAAVRAIARGDALTSAALDAGFSSSAHFSAAFREMFGLEPSRLAGGRLALAG